MPLYTNAVEGSRSSKRKKKSGVQKTMLAAAKAYTAACVKLDRRRRDGVPGPSSASSAVARAATSATDIVWLSLRRGKAELRRRPAAAVEALRSPPLTGELEPRRCATEPRRESW